MTEHELDRKFLYERLKGFIPPALRLVFEHYLSMPETEPVALLLPAEEASYFSLHHPRIQGSVELGVRNSDGVAVIPSTLAAEDITYAMNAATLIAIYDHGDAGAALRGIAAALQQLPSEGGADLVVPSGCVTDAGADPFRKALLEAGKVTDLFDGGTHCYIGWLAEPADGEHRTQAVEIPPGDEWPEFEQDLATWMPLWRWGDLVKLPRDRSWAWENLESDLVSMLLRVREEAMNATTSMTASARAYALLGFIELGLRYIVELRIGNDPQEILSLLPQQPRLDLKASLGRSRREDALRHIYFINYKHILNKAWHRLDEVFAGTGETKSSLTRAIQQANAVRNRVAHPSKLERVTAADLQLLQRISTTLDRAIESAEGHRSVSD